MPHDACLPPSVLFHYYLRFFLSVYVCVCVAQAPAAAHYTHLPPLAPPPFDGVSAVTAHGTAHDTLYESESSPSSWSLSFASCPTGCHSHAYFTRRCPSPSTPSLASSLSGSVKCVGVACSLSYSDHFFTRKFLCLFFSTRRKDQSHNGAW